MFQKRQDGSVDFWREWDDYNRGFGNLNGNYWLGLDKIHRLTASGSYKLRVDLEDNYGIKAFAKYRSFTVENETAKYQLSKVNNFRGKLKITTVIVQWLESEGRGFGFLCGDGGLKCIECL